MAKTKAVAVTQAAQTAGTKLALWDTVEAEAKNRLAEAEAKKEGSDSWAEVHFNGSSVQGVVKVKDFILKISN
jgi:hypothetical protein